jgi:hypothetical protein
MAIPAPTNMAQTTVGSGDDFLALAGGAPWCNSAALGRDSFRYAPLIDPYLLRILHFPRGSATDAGGGHARSYHKFLIYLKVSFARP